MITSGFSINGVMFRIGAIALAQEPPVLIESWSCRNQTASIFRDPSDRLKVRISFDPAHNVGSMLRCLLGEGPGFILPPKAPELFADVIERVFGGLSPYPARPEVVMKDYRPCWEYRLSMIVRAIYLELRANILVGSPPIRKTSVGVIRIPCGYAYVATGQMTCCEEGPQLPKVTLYEDDWLTDRKLADIHGLLPLERVWKTALDQKKANQPGVVPKSGLTETADQGDWELEPGSPAFDIGPD